MAKALYPGSFDPLTYGHLDLVQRGLELFESVTVAVAENISKVPMFGIEDRLALLRELLPETPRLQVCTFRGLVVDFCRLRGTNVIMRGLRTVSDFEYEYQMALTNRQLNSEIETVFVMPNVKYSFVSSSLIKDIMRNGGDVSAFVPAQVEARMRERLLGDARGCR